MSTVSERWGIKWNGRSGLFGLVLVLPALVLVPINTSSGVALAIGVIPAAIVGLSPSRGQRGRVFTFGVTAGLCLLLGSALAALPPMAAVAALFILAVAITALGGHPLSTVLLNLGLPLVALGLSYTPGDAVGLAGLIVVGSIYALAVSLIWPTWTPRLTSGPTQPTPTPTISFGIRLGLAVASAAAIGFGLGLEHVGWAAGAAALVMRPQPALLYSRGIDRLIAVAIGAAAACLLVAATPPAWILGVVVAADLILLAATSKSRIYLAGGFNTFVVFLFLLNGAAAGDAARRFWERILETVLGVGLAAIFGLLLPTLTSRIHKTQRPATKMPPTSGTAAPPNSNDQNTTTPGRQ